MKTQEFINWLVPAAKDVCCQYRLPASVCIAQGALESNWGEAVIGKYNLFGRKWNGIGRFIEVSIQEFQDDGYQIAVAKFKDYDSLAEAVTDWCLLIREDIRYYACRKAKGDYGKFVAAFSAHTSPDRTYHDKLLATIHANQLRQYDCLLH